MGPKNTNLSAVLLLLYFPPIKKWGNNARHMFNSLFFSSFAFACFSVFGLLFRLLSIPRIWTNKYATQDDDSSRNRKKPCKSLTNGFIPSASKRIVIHLVWKDNRLMSSWIQKSFSIISMKTLQKCAPRFVDVSLDILKPSLFDDLINFSECTWPITALDMFELTNCNVSHTHTHTHTNDKGC